MHYLLIYTFKISHWLRAKQKYKRKKKKEDNTMKYDLFKIYIIQVTVWQTFAVIYMILKKNHTASTN